VHGEGMGPDTLGIKSVPHTRKKKLWACVGEDRWYPPWSGPTHVYWWEGKENANP